MYSDKKLLYFLIHRLFVFLTTVIYISFISSSSRGHRGVTTDQSYEGSRAPPVRHGNTQLCVNRSGQTGYQR